MGAMPEDMVCVRPSCISDGGPTDEVMVCDRPGGGAAPNMLEKAASRPSRWYVLGLADPY